jgi:hemolysin D
MAVFGVALAWACLGTVDIVAMAPGKIIPSGRTKVIQPFETGVVRAIQAHDGQSVKAGDTLIELDPTMSGAEVGHLKSDLVSAQLDAARLRAAITGHDDPLADFKPPEGAESDLIDMHRHFLISQTAEQNAKLAEIDRQVAQKEVERATVDATIKKLDATIPLLQERVDVRKQLYQKEIGSKLLYLTELQDLIGQQQDLLVQKSKFREADAAIASLVETRMKTAAQYERSCPPDVAFHCRDYAKHLRTIAECLRMDIVEGDISHGL